MRIDFLEPVEHELPGSMDVFNFASAIIYFMPEIAAVTAASPIIRGNHSITLLQHFPDDAQVFIGGHIPVNFAVRQNEQRQFSSAASLTRHESECSDNDMI